MELGRMADMNVGGKEEVGGKSKMGGKERRKVESLGWLTESSVMPKKQRAIGGVGASSIVELRAELYRTQEDVRKAKEGGVDLDAQRSRKKFGVPDKFSLKNAGIEERAAKDKLHLKAENDGSASYAALEKKAELYEKLVKGDVPDDEAEKYSVDFLRKGFLDDEYQEMERERRGEPSTPTRDAQDNSTGPSGSQRNNSSMGWTRDGARGLSQEHKQIIREVNEETKNARERTSNLKQQRQMQAAKKREQLRHAYLKRQVEKLKAAAQQVDQVKASGDVSSSGAAITKTLAVENS